MINLSKKKFLFNFYTSILGNRESPFFGILSLETGIKQNKRFRSELIFQFQAFYNEKIESLINTYHYKRLGDKAFAFSLSSSSKPFLRLKKNEFFSRLFKKYFL